jgi:BASS family bile acid:Na+ symporter
MEMTQDAPLHFDQTAALITTAMVGFLVFSVALDLKLADFKRVLESPKGPLMGLVAQFGVLPGVAFTIARLMAPPPGVALGLVLVACCPGGPLSNYLTGLAKGNVALSVTMTAVSTTSSIVITPLIFALWSSLDPSMAALVSEIQVEPWKLLSSLVLMVALPVASATFINSGRPELARRIQKWVRPAAMLVFAAVVVAVLGSNMKALVESARQAFTPVAVTFTVAVALAWILARATKLRPTDRRAIAIEVGLQNVPLALGMSLTFFPGVAGVAITAMTWGVIHIVGGFACAASWARVPAVPRARIEFVK